MQRIEKSQLVSMHHLRTVVFGRAEMLSILLDECLADVPDAEFVRLTVWKDTEDGPRSPDASD